MIHQVLYAIRSRKSGHFFRFNELSEEDGFGVYVDDVFLSDSGEFCMYDLPAFFSKFQVNESWPIYPFQDHEKDDLEVVKFYIFEEAKG